MRWVDKLFLCLHKAFQEGMQSIPPLALWNDFSLSWSKGQNYTSLDLVWLYLQEIDLFSSSSSLYIEFSLSFYCCHMKSFCNLCHSIFYSSIPNNLASPANLATSDYCLFCILMMNKIGPTVDPDGQPVVNIIMKIALFFPSIFFLLFYAITYLQDYSMVVYLFRRLRWVTLSKAFLKIFSKLYTWPLSFNNLISQTCNAPFVFQIGY